jgi:hypothetical protein
MAAQEAMLHIPAGDVADDFLRRAIINPTLPGSVHRRTCCCRVILEDIFGQYRQPRLPQHPQLPPRLTHIVTVLLCELEKDFHAVSPPISVISTENAAAAMRRHNLRPIPQRATLRGAPTGIASKNILNASFMLQPGIELLYQRRQFIERTRVHKITNFYDLFRHFLISLLSLFLKPLTICILVLVIRPQENTLSTTDVSHRAEDLCTTPVSALIELGSSIRKIFRRS